MPTNIKKWYRSNYPSDQLGKQIDTAITFEELFEAMDNYKNVYEVLGDDIDSVIRERVFIKLAEIMGVEYDYVYDQWLKCKG